MQRSEALKKAELLISGPRAKAYGDAYETHQNIAKMWSIVLKKEITVHDVYRCMIALKCVRLNKTPKHEDSMIDIIGYAALAMEAFDGKTNT
jgi:hypothetical protein|tara:strand:+ start:1479 stop:1754 length:276 start_codon:yes stop_codon:yes gene_type:complete